MIIWPYYIFIFVNEVFHETQVSLGPRDVGEAKLNELCQPQNTIIWDLLQDHNIVRSQTRMLFIGILFAFNGRCFNTSHAEHFGHCSICLSLHALLFTVLNELQYFSCFTSGQTAGRFGLRGWENSEFPYLSDERQKNEVKVYRGVHFKSCSEQVRMKFQFARNLLEL